MRCQPFSLCIHAQPGLVSNCTYSRIHKHSNVPPFLSLSLVAHFRSSLHHVFHCFGSRSFRVSCIHGSATHYGAYLILFYSQGPYPQSMQLLYSIVLLCLGRHPLQNPHYIKPEIGKLPKSTVERIPLVIYIPPPPDDVGSPVSLPTAVHSYPPKPPPVVRKKRFAFIPRRIKKAGPSENQVEDAVKTSQLVDNNEEAETWEDNWVKSEDYGFVRLDRNRAVCAICLMDFEEPTKKSTVPERNAEMNQRDDPALPREEVEFPVERITEEERNALPQLQDAGEGPQPLRLLKCHHVFHVRSSATF